MRVLDVVEDADFCSLFFVTLVLNLVGRRMVSDKPALDQWGQRIAAVAFVSYLIFAGTTDELGSAEAWFGAMIRAIIAAALTLGSSWIALSFIAFAYEFSIAIPCRSLRRFGRSVESRVTQRRNRRREERERARARREWERSAPERERREQEAKARARAESERNSRSHKRREDARMKCDLLYNLHAAELHHVFPDQRYREFVRAYMSDEHAASYVEQRAKLLKKMILDSLGESERNASFKTIGDVAKHFQERRAEIESLSLPNDAKDTYIMELNRQEDHAIRRFLGS